MKNLISKRAIVAVFCLFAAASAAWAVDVDLSDMPSAPAPVTKAASDNDIYDWQTGLEFTSGIALPIMHSLNRDIDALNAAASAQGFTGEISNITTYVPFRFDFFGKPNLGFLGYMGFYFRLEFLPIMYDDSLLYPTGEDAVSVHTEILPIYMAFGIRKYYYFKPGNNLIGLYFGADLGYLLNAASKVITTSYFLSGDEYEKAESDLCSRVYFAGSPEIGLDFLWSNGARTIIKLGYLFCPGDFFNPTGIEMSGPYLQAGFVVNLEEK